MEASFEFWLLFVLVVMLLRSALDDQNYQIFGTTLEVGGKTLESIGALFGPTTVRKESDTKSA